MRASLTELNSKSNALARAAQAGETVVITDRGTPIADIVPHQDRSWVTRAELADGLGALRTTMQSRHDTADAVRADMDAVVDPYLDVEI